MVRCDKCDVEIPYLPFRCKYCGKYFCRDHRLPENHACTGRFNAPVVVVPAKMQKEMGIKIEEQALKHHRKGLYQDEGTDGREKKGMRYHRLRNRWFSSPGWRRFQESKFGQYMVTHIFLILFVTGLILSFWIPEYILLIPAYFIFQFFFHTIITAVFVPSISGNYFGIIFTVIFLYFFYRIGKQLETLFGRKFVIKFVFICGILTGAVYLVAVLLFSLIPGYDVILTLEYTIYFNIGTNYGIFMGIAAFFAVLMPQQTMRLMFPPIQLKAKTVAIVFIAISVGMGFILWAADGFNAIGSSNMCSGLADLGGALGGYLIAKYGRARLPTRPPPMQFISQY